MQQYYTLEQAAQVLRTTPEHLKEMARKNEVRAFQDRGTLRFRSQEIDELARARGYGSDPELPLGDAAAAKSGDSDDKGGVFNFSLDLEDADEVPIGKEPAADKPGSKPPSSSRKPGASKLGPKPGASKLGPKPGTSKLGPKSAPPKASSDSDVRLVMDGDMDFNIDVDSKAPASRAPISPPPKAPQSPPPKGGSSKSRLGGPPKDDSGVRIVPLDQPSDSDVKITPTSPHDSDIPIGTQPAKKQSDSDIRIEELTRPGTRDPLVTEEIDLDAEQRKADAASKAKGTRHKPKAPGAAPSLPTSSPFELSEADLGMDGATIPPPARKPEKTPSETDSSSDFELKPLDDSSPLDLGSSGEIPLVGDDEVSLGELTGGKGASGINLQDPADSGISLEEGSGDEMEFELSLDAGNTPKPAPAKSGAPDSSSEFELSLQEDDSPTDGGSSSEFELSLDPENADLAVDEGSSDLALAPEGESEGSSSEFELTLDESGGLSVEEEGEAAEGEGDIFETDFEVPALDEESGSEAVALDEADTDLESSEFDLSLEGEDASGSQVVPLEDEEEYEEGAATVQRPAAGAVLEEDEEGGLEDIGEDLDADLDQEPVLEEEEEVAVAAAPAAAAAPAEWGILPAMVLLPCTIVLFVVGLMSFELIQGMSGYHKQTKVSNLVLQPIAKMFDDKLPDD